MNLPPASLIIPSRDRPEMLYDTVKSVLEGEALPAELVIVDQSDRENSSLAALDSRTGCRIHYVWHRDTGLSAGRNAGIGVAKHKLIAFTDDDVIVSRTWFGNLIGALLKTGERSAVTGRVLPMTSSWQAGFAPSTKEDEAATTYSGRVGEDVLFPLNMAMYASAFAEVGTFDVRLGAGTVFPGAEDNDFGFRLLEAGYQIQYVPEAIVYHRAWRSPRQFVPMRWNYGHGQGAFYAKYFSLSDRYMLARMWADGVRHLGYLFRYAWKRSFRQNSGDLVYLAGMISGAARWLLTQRKTP